MRTLTLSTYIAGALAMGVVGAVPANAMPADGFAAAPLPLVTTTQPEVTLVSGGCGPFRHRGFNGGCYPNGGFRPYGGYRPYGYGYGYHRHFFHPF